MVSSSQSESGIKERARKYSRIKYLLAIINLVYLIALLFLYLSSGMSRLITDKILLWVPNNLSVFPTYLLITLFLYSCFDFPLNFYGSFLLEHKFSLTKQTFKYWVVEQLKSGVLSYILALVLFGAFYFIVRNNPNTWWLFVSGFWIFVTFILARLLPTVILPLFFKYKDLTDQTLRQRIITLAKNMQVKVLNVFEIDFSKKTLKANAAFLGWGSSRRVILADTLKDKYTHEEIEVILAHEFAHYKLKHLFKLMLVNSGVTFISFYLIFITSGFVLHSFGFSKLTEVAAFPLVLMYFVLVGFFMQPCQNYISRLYERQADKMAIEITANKEAFISVMNKLADQNLSDRDPHPLIKFFFFDHPPISERIALAKS